MSSDAVKTLVQPFFFMSPELLRLTVLRHHGWSDEPAAVCSECGCTFDVRRSTLWPHNASATGAAVASGSSAGGFQDGLHPGLPVTVKYGSSLLGRRLSAGLWPRSKSATLCQLKDVSSDGPTAAMQTDVLLLQVQKCEQSSSSSETLTEQFKWLLKTFLFGCWDCGALWLTVKLRLLSCLPYLLTW